MVNKCAVEYCNTGKTASDTDGIEEKNARKISTFHFPTDDEELLEKWIYFTSRREWKPTKYSVLCEKHFDENYIKHGDKRNKLKYELRPIPTIHTNDSSVPESVLRVPKIPRQPPTDRNAHLDEKPAFKKTDKIKSINCLTEEHCPAGFSYKLHEGKVVYYNLQFDYTTSVPMVFESIIVDEKLHVTLSFKGNHIPLPKFLRDNQCLLNKFSILENLPAYVRAKANEANPIIEELNSIQHYSPHGRPPYPPSIIRWAILLRHTSPQAYRKLRETLPLPSFELLKKIKRGGVDSVKAIQRLLQMEAVSKDCVLLVDEMYLQKVSQYFSGDYKFLMYFKWKMF